MSVDLPSACRSPSEPETSALLERYAGGEPEALDRLLERYRGEIRHVVGQRIPPALQARLDGSDVAQEALLTAARRIDEYLADRPMPFRWWLRKLALQQLGKAQARHRTATKRSVEKEQRLAPAASSSIAQQLAALQPDPGSDVAKQEMADCVMQALGRLSQTDQELLVMRYFEKLTNTQIGYLLELTPDAVNKRHARSLLRLRTAIGELIDDSDLK